MNARSHLYIDEWMAELCLNDETLGERLGKSRVTVWRWRSEQHRLNPGKIAAIAAALGREPEELFRSPSRPSLDAIVKNASDDMVKRAAEVVTIIVKTGT